MNMNKFLFISFNRNFALSFYKLGCISTIKIKRVLFCIVFDLHYLCT